jgi:hypothetical protein
MVSFMRDQNARESERQSIMCHSKDSLQVSFVLVSEKYALISPKPWPHGRSSVVLDS